MSDSLRIGLICHHGVGGSSRITVALAIELARRGHGVHVFTQTAPLAITTFPPGIELHTLCANGSSGPVADLDADWPENALERLIELVVAVVNRRGLDVLHFHYAVPFARVAAGVRQRLGGRSPALVGTLHGTDVDVCGAAPLRSALGEADLLTTVSRSHAALAAETFRLSSPPEVIPNFVDTSRFRPNGAGSSSAPRIIHVSNFRAVKEPRRVARIFIELRRRVQARLWLVGDGDELESVRMMLADAGVAGDVHCCGLRLDVENILPRAELLLLTSRTESFSLAALEAAACGVPVVAPRVGGLPEVVEHGETGYLFDPGDEGAATAVLAQLLARPRLRQRMRRAAVARARRFDAACVVPRYEAVYRSVVNGGAHRRH